MRIPCRHSRGFTLLEVAIGLLIFGLVTITAMTAANKLLEAARERSTRTNQDAIKVALQNFMTRNGRLPCPALPALASTAATFGVEAPTPGTCTGATVLPGGGVSGTLPWKSIGISIDNAVDGWNNQFDFAVTTTATNTSFTTIGGIRGVLTLHSGTPTATGLPPTGNQLNACSTVAGDNSCNLFAVVVLISHGRNGLGARNWAGASLTAPISANELENANTTNVAFVRAEFSDVDASAFDDVVMAIAPADLLAPLLAQGFVKIDTALLQEKFRLLVAELASDAVANRTGSPGSYGYPMPAPTGGAVAYALDASKFSGACGLGAPPGTLQFLPTAMQTIVDPWGNQFRYQRADAAYESTETCPTGAIFVSAGPDGSIATAADNTVYYVSKAELDAVFVLSGW